MSVQYNFKEGPWEIVIDSAMCSADGLLNCVTVSFMGKSLVVYEANPVGKTHSHCKEDLLASFGRLLDSVEKTDILEDYSKRFDEVHQYKAKTSVYYLGGAKESRFSAKSIIESYKGD